MVILSQPDLPCQICASFFHVSFQVIGYVY
jgi:hypothetical protein